ncbi:MULTISPECIES: cation diffusion facilitator family transporter [unclassified Rhizobium]|uniref:cation diffusion facilitator family transporter n=1 Tax=unclassified Rhizobium TaxID=2613769 RepID=UPI0027D3FE3A|nr:MULTISPECIES: cation diffusion facilitator family transporter [unclassified Rhizobium]MDQ4408733.1 cation diffusion facilitator family transporter [Rhizobium sp. AN63]
MLSWAFALTSIFLAAEVIAGFYFNSLALLSDAAHMMTDAAALAIALLAVRFGNRQADDKRTFGYKRLEVLAAAFNAMLLFAVAIYVLVEAIKRFSSPEPIGSVGMFVVAFLGLLVNLASMRILASGRDKSFNVKGAYLEVWADMLGSVGVTAGAITIYLTGWTWIDPVVAVGIALWVLPRTWILLRDTTNVLLEGVPAGLRLNEVRQTIEGVQGITSVHDLHVWTMAGDEISLTAHIILTDGVDAMAVRSNVESMLADRWRVHHTTIQVDRADEMHSGIGYHS